MKAVVLIPGLLVIVLIGLLAMRWSDMRRESAVWRKLAATADASAPAFDPAMVEALPEVARRYFLFTIAPGTTLHTVAEIQMGGEIGLGDKENPSYQPMQGHQILAPPHGLVWKLVSGQGAMRLSGPDGFDGTRSWTRFPGKEISDAAFWRVSFRIQGVRWFQSGHARGGRQLHWNGGLFSVLQGGG